LALGFLSSLRGRVIVVMVLGLGATAFAVVALTLLARTSREQRTVRAHERVEAEIERMVDSMPRLSHAQRMRHGRRGAGELRSGYVDDPSAIESERLAGFVRQAQASGKLEIVASVGSDNVPIVVGATPVDGGGYVWVVQRVVIGPETASLRVSVMWLSLAMFALVIASVHTLVVFDRGTRLLLGSVGALSHDLHAKVPRPNLRELAEVADRLDSLARDVSLAEEERVRLVKELSEHERWAALGRVVAGVAHEVRNPLAAIKLRTDLAEASPDLAPALRDDFKLIGSEVARLDRLVRDLLLLTGNKSATRVDGDVAQLCEERAVLLRPWAKSEEVELFVSGSGRAPIDRDAMTRAVDNLLRNAVEASPKGSSVEVSVAAGEKVTVTVADRGQGVPAESAPLLFEPFFTTKTGGTGLGLALSRSVAEAHGGALRYERGEGVTRFVLEFLRVAPIPGPSPDLGGREIA
jgi:signal transduction histidine kinase